LIPDMLVLGLIGHPYGCPDLIGGGEISSFIDKSILDEEEHPTEYSIKKKMAGNLCRCTGYKKIVEAVISVKEQSGEGT